LEAERAQQRRRVLRRHELLHAVADEENSWDESQDEKRGVHSLTSSPPDRAMTIAVASMLLAVTLAAIVGQPVSDAARYLLIVPLAIAKGSKMRLRGGSPCPTSPPPSSP
jgi:hypothetical protein